MSALAQEKIFFDKIYTIDDIYALPEGERAEKSLFPYQERLATISRTPQEHVRFTSLLSPYT